MIARQSDVRPPALDVRAAVLVPLRSLRQGKLRLATVRTAEERARLIEHMADVVVRAAHDLPVLVVHDDPEVEAWADARGAETLRPAEPGLNRAVSAGHRYLRDRGVDRTIVVHADLPRAHDLRPLGDHDGITLVSDRLGDGTNALSLPTALEFAFAYGPGSFAVHLDLARATGLDVRVLDEPDLAIDIDHPDDLALLEEDHRP